jgi:2-amino-4-hydroxy-6-hydroxymethyldihydropteridine diphosphokinase
MLLNLKGLNLSGFLGLGSNIGTREQNLAEAADAIGQISDCIIKHLSSIYETEPWGKKDQDPFLNQVIEIETELNPQLFFTHCQEIERKMGRKYSVHWGPRIIDIDLLLWGDQIIDDEILKIPHPTLTERKFVLIPLTEIAPSFPVPGSGKTTREVLKECRDTAKVGLYK